MIQSIRIPPRSQTVRPDCPGTRVEIRTGRRMVPGASSQEMMTSLVGNIVPYLIAVSKTMYKPTN